jgi:hypothetical protein
LSDTYFYLADFLGQIIQSKRGNFYYIHKISVAKSGAHIEVKITRLKDVAKALTGYDFGTVEFE